MTTNMNTRYFIRAQDLKRPSLSQALYQAFQHEDKKNV